MSLYEKLKYLARQSDIFINEDGEQSLSSKLAVKGKTTCTPNRAICFCFPDDRCVLPHESIAAEHCPDHHLRGGASPDGSNRVRRFLEVSGNSDFAVCNAVLGSSRVCKALRVRETE